MKRAILFLIRVELLLAVHLGAVGEYWAARADRRYRKFSGIGSGVLK